MIAGEPLQILLVEDDDDHAEVVFRALAVRLVVNRIHRVADGEAALGSYWLARNRSPFDEQSR